MLGSLAVLAVLFVTRITEHPAELAHMEALNRKQPIGVLDVETPILAEMDTTLVCATILCGRWLA